MRKVKKMLNSERQMFPYSVRSFLPGYYKVALSQVEGDDCIPLVKVGERVKEGQLIAQAPVTSSEMPDIHSPVPGIVEAIEDTINPDGKTGKSFKITLDGEFSFLAKKTNALDWNVFSSAYLIDSLKSKGVINTFEKTQSLAKQINEFHDYSKKFLIVRMFDEDPSRLTDSFIAQYYTEEVVKGAYIVSKAMEADALIFAVPKNYSYEIDYSKLYGFPVLVVEVDTRKYPCGYKLNLIQSVRDYLKKNDIKHLYGKELEQDLNTYIQNSIFIDPQTSYDSFNAIVYGIPVMEHFVQITGNCLRSAAIFKVRIGTPISDLIRQCGGFKMNPSKVIVNGIISGNMISKDNFCINKYVKYVAFIPFGETFDQNAKLCIRCGKCRLACPEELFPDLMYRHVVDNFEISTEMKKTSFLCTGCNLCNSSCPARLSLSQAIESLRNSTYEK